jgi:hypothetical protein
MSTKATGVLKDPDNETLSTIHSKYDVVAADKALHANCLPTVFANVVG